MENKINHSNTNDYTKTVNELSDKITTQKLFLENQIKELYESMSEFQENYISDFIDKFFDYTQKQNGGISDYFRIANNSHFSMIWKKISSAPVTQGQYIMNLIDSTMQVKEELQILTADYELFKQEQILANNIKTAQDNIKKFECEINKVNNNIDYLTSQLINKLMHNGISDIIINNAMNNLNTILSCTEPLILSYDSDNTNSNNGLLQVLNDNKLSCLYDKNIIKYMQDIIRDKKAIELLNKKIKQEQNKLDKMK